MREHESQPAFHAVAGVLRRRWAMIAGVSLLGAAATGAIGLLLPARYTAKTQLVIDLPSANVPSALDDAAIETRVELLLSEEHLKRVYISLGGTLEDPASPSDDQGFFSWFSSRPGADTGVPEFDVLKRHMNAFKERKSRVIGVTYTANDPQFAAKVANRAADLYLTTEAERRRTERDEQLKALDVQVPLARAELGRAEATLQSFRTTSGLAEGKRADVSADEIAELTRQLALAKSELSARRAKVSALNDLIRTGAAAPEVIDSLQDPALADLIRADAAMGARYRPASGGAEMDAARRIQDVRSKLGLSANRHLAAWSEDAENIQSRVRLLEARLDMVRAATSAARDAELRMSELQREATASEQLFEGLLKKQKDLRSSAADPPDVRIASVASPPERPSSPNPLLFVLPGMCLAGFIASFVTVLRDRLDTSMRGQQEVATHLGTPCIGVVPTAKGVRRIRPFQIVRSYPFAQLTDAVRSIVLLLDGSAGPAKRPEFVVVTSSVKGEGKTVLSTSMATAAASLGLRVLLVDLDFRNPGVCRELGVQSDAGLLAFATGRPASECVLRMEHEGFDILGLPPNRATPMPARALEELPRLLREAGADYDLIIADAGAVLAAAETILIANQADLVLFAVRWGMTRENLARNALSEITSAPARAVLTRVDLKKHAKYRFGDAGEILRRLPARGRRTADA